MNNLKPYRVKQITNGWYEVYRILYASEIDYHLVATFKWKEDMEDYTLGDY